MDRYFTSDSKIDQLRKFFVCLIRLYNIEVFMKTKSTSFYRKYYSYKLPISLHKRRENNYNDERCTNFEDSNRGDNR